MAVHRDTLLRMSAGIARSWNVCRVAKPGPQWGAFDHTYEKICTMANSF